MIEDYPFSINNSKGLWNDGLLKVGNKSPTFQSKEAKNFYSFAMKKKFPVKCVRPSEETRCFFKFYTKFSYGSR